MNSNTISNGIVANFNLTLTYPGIPITVSVTNGSGTTPTGTYLTVGGGIGAAGTTTYISGLTCAATTLTGGDSSTCTISLSGPAPSGGAGVTLSSSNLAATVPASVMIPAGATSATFNVATSQVGSAQTSVLAANYLGSSQSANLTIAPAATLSSISCALPTVSGAQTMASASRANCTLNLTANTSAGQTFTLTSNSGSLSVPATVAVSAGSSSASFTMNSAVLPTPTKSVTLTASGYGLSQSLTFTIAILPSALSCTPNAIALNGPTTTCTVTLTQTIPSAITVALSSNAGTRISMPSALTVPSGSASANFTGTVGAVDYMTVTVKAALNGVAQSANFTIGMVPPNSLTCSPASLVAGQSSTCTYTLVGPAPSGGDKLLITSSSATLSVPAQVIAPAASTSGTFAVSALTGYAGPVVVTIKGDGIPATATISAAGAPKPRKSDSSMPVTGLPQSLTCSPKLAHAGSTVTCEVQLMAATENAAEVAISASNPSMHVPQRIIGRPHQSAISFQAGIDASTATNTVIIQAAAGESVAEERITVEASRKPELTVPGKQFAAFGETLRFQVATSSGTLGAESLPAGASFEAATGTFEWTPQSSQHGLFKVRFSATDLSRRSSDADVLIQTGNRSPVIDSIENAASGSTDAVCSSGSLATIRGGWLAPDSQVLVNGASVQTVSSSSGQVTFVCPSGTAGSNLQISVANRVGRSAAHTVVLRDAAPGIFTVDGSGQAAATILDGSQLAMTRNHRFLAQPAQPGDKVQVPVTGLPADADPKLIGVSIADVEVSADALQPIPGAPGAMNVGATLPNAVSSGDSVPVVIHYRSRDGQVFTSQKTTIAIEPAP